MTYPECEGETEIRKIPYYYKKATYLGEFEAEVCKKCNSRYFTEKGFSEIRRVATRMRIWGERAISEIFEESTVSDDHGRVPVIMSYQLFPRQEIYQKTIMEPTASYEVSKCQ